MAEYEVKWVIDIEANDYTEAAKKALEIQRDKTSIATCFLVRERGRETGVYVDLDGLTEVVDGRP